MLSYLCFSLYFYFDFNYYEFTSVLICMICFDSSCYVAGKTLGKNKIFNKISPNKTYEGLIGGIIITNIIAIMFYFSSDFSKFLINYNLIFVANFVIIFFFWRSHSIIF